MNRKSSRRRRTGNSTIVLLMTSAVIACGFLIYNDLTPSLSPDSLSAIWAQGKDSDRLITAEAFSKLFGTVPNQRVVYPYSVVPGGVRTPQELKDASAQDPVVAAHYAGFNYQKARVVQLKQARLVYLSYRIGNKVFWTTKQVSLRSGEKLITDGKTTARTRCANQVSELPHKERSPQEPSVAQLDNPADGSSMQTDFPANFHSALESRGIPAWSPSGLGPANPMLVASGFSPLSLGFLPLGSPLLPGSHTSKPSPSPSPSPSPTPGPGPGPGPSPTPGPPVTPVPEPGTIELIVSEMAAILFASKWALEKRKH